MNECKKCGTGVFKETCPECGTPIYHPPATVTLSRRNLIHLLARLEDGAAGPVVLKADGSLIVAEPDEVHYRDYQPGGLGDSFDTYYEIDAFLESR